MTFTQERIIIACYRYENRGLIFYFKREKNYEKIYLVILLLLFIILFSCSPKIKSLESVNTGDLIVTEIMKNPQMLDDSLGEWFEIYNTSDSSINIKGLIVNDLSVESDTFTVDEELEIAPGEFLTFAASDDPGFSPDFVYDYTYFLLANTADEVIISYGSTESDRVEYNSIGFPDTSGASLSLISGAFDYDLNDNGGNWTAGLVYYNGDDRGTPGTGN